MRTVGRYEIIDSLGKGGMAVVHLARQRDLDRLVALKELAVFHPSNPEMVQRFVRESRVAGSLAHPNIVTVFDFFEAEGTPFIAMEYCERGSLRPFVSQLTLPQKFLVLEHVLSGLEHGEEAGIVHRDLKPENLMVSYDGRIKIADFGIAKVTNDAGMGSFLTATGVTVGTPAYMAPEQALAREIGPWTDLYSLGCITYELFCGRLPFPEAAAPMAVMLQHINEPVVPPSALNSELDPRISDLILALLAKEPEQRPQSASDLIEEVDELATDLLGHRWARDARLLRPGQQPRRRSTPRPPSAPDVDVFQTYKPDPVPATDEPFITSGVHGAALVSSTPAPPPPEPDPAPGAEVPPAAEPAADTPKPEPVVAPPQRERAVDEAVMAESPASEPVAIDSVADAYETFRAPAVEPVEPEPLEPELVDPEPVAPAPVEPDPVEPVPVAREPVERELLEPDLVEPEPVEREPVKPLLDSSDTFRAPAARPEVPADTLAPARPVAGAAKSEAARRRSQRLVPVAVAVAVVAVTLAGLELGKEPTPPVEPTPTPAPPQVVESDGATIAVPAAWKEDGTGPAAVALDDGVTLTAGDENTVTIGHSEDAGNPALLPDPLRERAGDAKPERVALGNGVEAYRYAIRDRERRLRVYTVPTEDAAAMVVCSGPESFDRACDEAAASLKLTRAKPVSLGPDADYAKGLDTAIGRLDTRRRSARAALADAKTVRSQRAAANDLASAYAGARKGISALEPPLAAREGHAALESAVERADRVHKRLATAARRGQTKRFRSLATDAKRSDASISDALEALAPAGYLVS